MTVKLNPRKVFYKRGACSNAMYHLLNLAFLNDKLSQERASDLLAGGIAMKGHQCGMLWGGALGIGTEAYNRFDDKNIAIVASINASRKLIDSFRNCAGAVDCRAITKVDWEKTSSKLFYMAKTIACGFVFSPCFNLMAKWTPEAVEAAKAGFSESIDKNKTYMSCATEVLRKAGATEEQVITVAGLAGGIGLSGGGCGALAAVIWYKMLKRIEMNPGKTPSMFGNPDAKKILDAFYTQTNSEMRCSDICKRHFSTPEEHTEYLQSGGCSKLIDILSKTHNSSSDFSAATASAQI